ncbi:MAG: molybdopterin-dependent oxidoreductase [Alphaproteobacteria bacterium]|nr:molybdopterin-dependent oxidoreductase [Alphaproteobacteria bacterium]
MADLAKTLFEGANLSRRQFLVRSAATGSGALFGIAMGPTLFAQGEAAAAVAGKSFTPAVWFTMEQSGRCNMHVVEAEMGQHIGTALAQIVAEELEVDWNDVVLDYPGETRESFDEFGIIYSVNSGSITTEFDRHSRAGALGRMALIEAGAQLLKAKVPNCTASKSRVIDRVSGRSLSYAEILKQTTIDKKFQYPDDFQGVELKPRGDYKIIGQSVPCLDIPEKTNGQAKYGIDIFLPNMVYGALVIPPARYGSKVLSVDESEAKKIPGYIAAVTVPDFAGIGVPQKEKSLGFCTGWVIAVADKFHRAMKAAQALKVEWDPGPYGKLTDADILEESKRLVADSGKGQNWVLEGDVDAALKDADQVLEAEYTSAIVQHAPMEPRNATVYRASDGTWHCYMGTQSPTFARMTLEPVLANLLGSKPEEVKVAVHQFILGGGFGLKQHYDVAVGAAFASFQLDGRPVKLIMTREADQALPFPRTPSYHKVRAGVKDGKLTAADHHIACGWMGPRLGVGDWWLQLPPDDNPNGHMDQWSIGGSDHWYTMQNFRVRAMDNPTCRDALQVSPLRTVSNSYAFFVVETYIDEIAHMLGRDPLEFRLSLLSGDGERRGIPLAGYEPGTPSDYYLDRLWLSKPLAEENTWIPYESATVGGAKRLANALMVAAGKAGYGTRQLPENTGIGIAVSGAEEHQSPTWVAGAAQVTVDRATGRYTVDRLTIAADMGIAINPHNVRAQFSGAALWGMSQMIRERNTLKNGSIQELNFHTYRPIRLKEVPKIDIEIIQSGHHPSGCGEPTSTVVAPAIGNAIFNAVGARVRQMPATPKVVLAALAEAKKAETAKK